MCQEEMNPIEGAGGYYWCNHCSEPRNPNSTASASSQGRVVTSSEVSLSCFDREFREEVLDIGLGSGHEGGQVFTS